MKKQNLNKVLFFLFLSVTIMAKAQEVSTEIIIKSNPQAVWDALTDFKDYPNWNPYIVYIEGELKLGKKINVTLSSAEGKKVSFKPEVKTIIFEKMLVMNMKIAFGVLLNANHIFQIEDNNDGTVTFIQKIEYSGLMSRFSNPESYKISFDKMNVSLKNKVEK